MSDANNNALLLREKLAIKILLLCFRIVQPTMHSFRTDEMVKSLEEMLK